MARWFFPFRESLQSPAIHQKDVEPSIAIVVIKGDSAAGSLKQVFVFLCSTEDGFRMQAGLASDVSKRHTQGSGYFLLRRGLRFRILDRRRPPPRGGR